MGDDDIELRLEEKDQAWRHALQNFRKICKELDKDDSGHLSFEELLSGFDNHAEFEARLSVMDVRREDMQTVWYILDQDNNGMISIDEFIEQLHRIKTQDSHTLLVFNSF